MFNMVTDEIYEDCRVFRVQGTSVDFYNVLRALRGERLASPLARVA